jgi:hypothetical protein
MSRCAPDCDCNTIPPTITHPDGRSTRLQPAAGEGVAACFGIAGAELLVDDGATATLAISITNYSWLRPRVLRVAAVDPASGTNYAAAVTVNSVTGVGRSAIGSATGVNGGAIDSYAERGLYFGRNIPALTSANTITVSVTNNAAVPLRIAAFVEGEALQ